MRASVLLLAAALGVVAAGCGSEETPATDAGTRPVDGGTSDPVLRIDAPAGLSLTDRPFAGAPAVGGAVRILRPSSAADPVSVWLNDAELAPPSPGLWAVGPGQLIPGAKAGSTLRLLAVSASARARLQLPCPADLTITHPLEDGVVAPGSTLTVRWSGRIGYDNPVKPCVQILPFDRAGNAALSLEPGANFRLLQGHETSAAVVVPPAAEDPFSGYVVELRVPGEAVETTEGRGFCAVVRRILVQRF